MHASDDDLLTVQDVAEILRVPTSWVYERTQAAICGPHSRFQDREILALSARGYQGLG